MVQKFWMPPAISEILKNFEKIHGRQVPESLRQLLQDIQANEKPLVYLAGPMRLQGVYDTFWRERYASKIEAMGYIVLNTVTIEGALYGYDYLTFQKTQSDLIARGRFRTFGNIFDPVLELDMALVHLLARHPKSCILAYFPTDVVKSGTDIECFEAFRLDVATFIRLEGPRSKIRPFLQAPWIRMYARGKFRAFRSWKSLMSHLEKRIAEQEGS